MTSLITAAKETKSTATLHNIFARLHKGSIHIITCSSCSCAPSFPIHCPSPVISVGFRFIHNSVYPSLPPVLSGTFVSVVQSLPRFTIYLA